jgi:hypothetical protein
MEMHQVRYFLALCDDLNFTRAAKRCGVAQPSLTRAIKLLEAELGGSLFVRSSKISRLSKLGNLVRRDFEQVASSAALAKGKAKKFLAAPSPPRKPNGDIDAHRRLRDGRRGRNRRRGSRLPLGTIGNDATAVSG